MPSVLGKLGHLHLIHTWIRAQTEGDMMGIPTSRVTSHRSRRVTVGARAVAIGFDGDVPARALVLSEHDDVRRQLVSHLVRSSRLSVSDGNLGPETVREFRPDLLVLDLSRVDMATLLEILAAAKDVGAQLIALASVTDPETKRAVVNAGGKYILKSVGADALAAVIASVAPG